MSDLNGPDLELARAIELHGLDVWRAPGEMALDGWRVKISGGFSHRLDSVTPVQRGVTDAASKLKWCERFYNERHLPCALRLTDLYDDEMLEPWLLGRGYQPHGHTHVMVADLKDVADIPPTGLSFSDDASDPWFATAMAVDKRAVMHAETMIFVMTHMPAPRIFVDASGGDGTIAIGCGQVRGPLMGIFSMRTVPDQQRKGHASRVLSGLLAQGKTQGVGTAWLQVERANTAAIALYRHFGFKPLYDYRYLVRHEARD